MSDAITRAAQDPHNWRKTLRKVVGGDGKLWRILLELAEGRAYRPVLPDGTEGIPVVPSPEVRLRATCELADRLYGKAVSATEQVAAEAQAADLATIQALSDADLEARAKSILERGLAQLDARKVDVREAAAVWWGGQGEDSLQGACQEDPLQGACQGAPGAGGLEMIDSTTPGRES